MYGTLDHEQHVLDLTNFDGEDDTHLPGERQLSQRLREEGNMRREQSRLSGLPAFSRDSIHEKRMSGFMSLAKHQEPNMRPSNLRQYAIANNSQLFVSLPEIKPFDETSLSPLSASSSTNPFMASSPYHDHAPFEPPDPRRFTRFDMDEIEAEDVPLVSELAQPGRASIEQVIAEEVSRSYKSMIVTCTFYLVLRLPSAPLIYLGCGPTTLNAVVRKSVAAQIKPLLIMRGRAPMIDLISEEFEW